MRLALLLIIIAVLGCSKDACDNMHKSIDEGMASLTERWECEDKTCLHDSTTKLLDKTLCVKHPEASQDRIAISLACTIATKSLALMGASLIGLKCKCNTVLVYNDLQKPSLLCPLFSYLP